MVTVKEFSWEEVSSPDFGSRAAWREAVAAIAEKARSKLPECSGRVDSAVKIVLAGDVELLPNRGRTSSRVTSRHLTTSQYGHSLSENTCFVTPGQRLAAQAVPRLQKCAENPIAMRYDTETYF